MVHCVLWCHILCSVVLVTDAVKEIMVAQLAPKHRNQWEYALQMCFQPVAPLPETVVAEQVKQRMILDSKAKTQIAKYRAKADKKRKAESLKIKHDKLQREMARFFLYLRNEKAPRVQTLQICRMLSTTTTLQKLNILLDEVHAEMVSEGLLKEGAVAEDDDEDEDDGEGDRGAAASFPSALSSTPAGSSTCSGTDSSSSSSGADNSSSSGTPAAVPQNCTPTKKVYKCPKKLYAAAKALTVPALAAKASESRVRVQQHAMRCIAYDENLTVATAVRIVEEAEGIQLVAVPRQFRKMSSVSIMKGQSEYRTNKHGVLLPPVTSCSSVDRQDSVVRNRLGYKCPQAFCNALDIMKCIRRAYREATVEGDGVKKEYLLGLICGSFSLSEVNRMLLPPEAHILPPGRVKNMELISMQKWMNIRKVGGGELLILFIYACWLYCICVCVCVCNCVCACRCHCLNCLIEWFTPTHYALTYMQVVGCSVLHRPIEAEKYAEGIRKRKRNQERQLARQEGRQEGRHEGRQEEEGEEEGEEGEDSAISGGPATSRRRGDEEERGGGTIFTLT